MRRRSSTVSIYIYIYIYNTLRLCLQRLQSFEGRRVQLIFLTNKAAVPRETTFSLSLPLSADASENFNVPRKLGRLSFRQPHDSCPVPAVSCETRALRDVDGIGLDGISIKRTMPPSSSDSCRGLDKGTCLFKAFPVSSCLQLPPNFAKSHGRPRPYQFQPHAAVPPRRGLPVSVRRSGNPVAL